MKVSNNYFEQSSIVILSKTFQSQSETQILLFNLFDLRFIGFIVSTLALFESSYEAMRISPYFSEKMESSIMPVDRFTISWLVISIIASFSMLFSFITMDNLLLQTTTVMLIAKTIYSPFIILVFNKEKWYFTALTIFDFIATSITLTMNIKHQI